VRHIVARCSFDGSRAGLLLDPEAATGFRVMINGERLDIENQQQRKSEKFVLFLSEDYKKNTIFSELTIYLFLIKNGDISCESLSLRTSLKLPNTCIKG
jgi:ABC-type sugar transport system ATPase subunit